MAGLILQWLHHSEPARILWFATTAIGLALSGVSTWRAIAAQRPTVDVIAFLALVGALLVDEPFAGAVIAVMLTTGSLLESRAAARASRELGLLVARSPQSARRFAGTNLEVVPVAEVVPGDRILVGTGEVVPVDARLLTAATFDESALTGEPAPVDRPAGDEVRSGVVNAAGPVEMLVTTTWAESTYSGVLRLVEQAKASSAPFVRMADRIALAFVPFTLLLAGGAWLLTGDPVRAVAVLVVATPCPLLLAAPIAIMSGLSRAARIGVIIKGGGALERLAAGRVLLFDKTGTLTMGHPVLSQVVTDGTSGDELLALAASLDQVSPHVLATAIVTGARQRGLELVLPEAVVEHHGYGLVGQVQGREVRLGKAEWLVEGALPAWAHRAKRRAGLDGSLTVFAAVDGALAGVIILEDPIRPDAPRMLRALKAAGITRTVLVTGDRAEAAESVGRVVGVDAVQADRDPAEKVAVVESESSNGPTIMVGDGINDAPALAVAGVGVALAARGATAASETADVVLTVERIGVLADAIRLAQRAKRIALESAVIGMGLCLIAMVLAAFGALTPAEGAVLQEVIDVVAILVALRAVLPGEKPARALGPVDATVARSIRAEHVAVRYLTDEVRSVADSLEDSNLDLNALRRMLELLESKTLPHERDEDARLFPLLAARVGGIESVLLLRRSHAEIELKVARLRSLLADQDGPALEPSDLAEVRGLLYGLQAVMVLHNAQEEEFAFGQLI